MIDSFYHLKCKRRDQQHVKSICHVGYSAIHFLVSLLDTDTGQLASFRLYACMLIADSDSTCNIQ